MSKTIDAAWESGPEQLEDRLRGVPDDATLVVDFDETLWLRNSTEAYLASLRPRFLAAPLLWLLDILKPWRFLGGEAAADWLRVLVATIVFPWTALMWPRRAAEIGARHANEALLMLLRQRAGARIVVATQGFNFIVGPLLDQLALPNHERRVCRFWRGRADRLGGKPAMLQDVPLEQSVVITDSEQDAPLLELGALPLLVKWPEARYERALAQVYVPLRYAETIKRPGQRYFVHGVVLEDWAFWVLATVVLSASPALHVLGLLFLLVSFWCIYEVGYIENDRVAELYEKDPVLSDKYHAEVLPRHWLAPWCWATVVGAIGIALAHPTSWPGTMAVWLAVLLGLRAVYYVYNHVDKNTRAWLSPLLHAFRSFAAVAIVPVGLAGALALAAHAWCRSTAYLYYRMVGGKFPQASMFLMRLSLFTLLFFAAWLADMPLNGLEVILLLSWALFRARRELGKVLRGVRRISGDRA